MAFPHLEAAHQAILQHSCVEKRPQELEHPLVFQPFGRQAHEDIVIYPVKELFQVDIHHKAVALGDIRLRLGYRLVRRASGAKAVTVLGERPVPGALQHLQHRLLNETIQHRGDA